jgi:hypothetical protein
VVTNPGRDQSSTLTFARLDDDQVDPDWKAGQRRAIGQSVRLGQPAYGRSEVASLAPVERLLGDTECPTRPPANLDNDDRGRGSRIDRQDIDLVSPKPEIASEDRPAGPQRPTATGRWLRP